MIGGLKNIKNEVYTYRTFVCLIYIFSIFLKIRYANNLFHLFIKNKHSNNYIGVQNYYSKNIFGKEKHTKFFRVKIYEGSRENT